MSNFKNFNAQDFQQKQTFASTSQRSFINLADAELSQDSYESNTNDTYSDISFESQRRPFESQVKSNNGKAQGGRPRAEIWDYFQKGKLGSTGHYRARCYYCSKEWAKGEPTKLEIHLGYECARCPENIREYWVTKIIDKQNNYQRTLANKRKKIDPTQTNIATSHFKNDEPLPLAEQNSLDQAVLKAWIAAGIPFSVIKNPFIIDLFMRLNPRYIPPSRSTLSGRILQEEAVKVKTKINKIFEKSENLTLSKQNYIYHYLFVIFFYI
jgi:BED zinc finger.